MWPSTFKSLKLTLSLELLTTFIVYVLFPPIIGTTVILISLSPNFKLYSPLPSTLECSESNAVPSTFILLISLSTSST